VLPTAGDCVGAFARENTLEQAAIGRRQAPVIACYDFSKPMVCLEIPGNNRRDFFARSPRAGRAGPTAGKSAGRKSPDPKCQDIDSIGDFDVKIFSCFGARYRSHLSMTNADVRHPEVRPEARGSLSLAPQHDER